MYSIIYNTNKESAVCWSLTKGNYPSGICAQCHCKYVQLFKKADEDFTEGVGQALLDQPDSQNIKTLG